MMLSIKKLVGALVLGAAFIAVPVTDAAVHHPSLTASRLAHKTPVKAKVTPKATKTKKKIVSRITKKKALAKHTPKKGVKSVKKVVSATKRAGKLHHPQLHGA